MIVVGLVGITRLHIHIPSCVSFPCACRFGDSKGMNYVQFLEQLQPPEKLEDKYQTRMTQLSTTQAGVYTTAKSILVYRKLGSTSTGTYIRRLRICAVRIAWGTYNHGVLLNDGKNTVIRYIAQRFITPAFSFILS